MVAMSGRQARQGLPGSGVSGWMMMPPIKHAEMQEPLAVSHTRPAPQESPCARPWQGAGMELDMGAELEDTATDVEDAGREVLATTPEVEDAATLVDPGVLLPEDARLEDSGVEVPLAAEDVDGVVLEEPDPITDEV